MPSTDVTRNPRTLALIGLAIAVVLVASIFSCTRTEPELRPVPSDMRISTTTAPASTSEPAVTGTAATTPSTAFGAAPSRRSQVATVRADADDVPVYDSASATGEPEQVLPAEGDYGQRQVFLVLESEGPRLHVLLPVRPNGSQG